MKTFSKFILAIFLFSLALLPAAAQIPSGYVQTTATVASLANGSFGASWTNLSSSPQLGLLGCVSTFQTTVSGQFDAYGHFSTLLADTAQICPTPSTWTFTLSFACPAGAPPTSFTLQVAITGGGGTEDISTQITAALPANPCGGRGQGGLASINSQTGPAVTIQSSGSTIAVTNPSSNIINLESTGGTGCTLGGIGQTDVLSVYPTGTCYGDSTFTWDHVNHNLINGDGTTLAAGAAESYFIGSNQSDTQGDQQDYLIGDTNSIHGTPGSNANIYDAFILGVTNSISVTPATGFSPGIYSSGMFGDSNTITSTKNGMGDVWIMGQLNTVEDTLASTAEAEIVGKNNDVNGSISTVQILGYLNRAENVSYEHTLGINGLVVGSENTIENTGGLTVQDFSTILGHLNYLHDCADCLAVGGNVEEATNHEMGIGMSRIPELKVTSGNVERTPLTLGLPAPIANAYFTGTPVLPTGTGTCNVAFTGGTGSGGTGVASVVTGQSDIGLPIQITAAGSYSVAPTTVTLTSGTLTCSGTFGVLATLAVIPACSSGLQGSFASFTDASTNVYGATISGGGSNKVMGYCDGTNWTVMGGGTGGGAESATVTGYIVLPGKTHPIYEEWGTTATLANNTPVVVTLPIAFPNACLQVIVGDNGPRVATGNASPVAAYCTSATTFTINMESSGETGSFFAVGW